MWRFTRIPRRIVLGSVVLTLVAGCLFQPAGALAGFGSSPGTPSLVSACSNGEHIKEAKP